ncbi:MAG TPA: kelch repeat-containing protein, partial [Bacteroidia bacterium]|nr:kelch repeat-containing protein [Bacteroidia bacterium]
MKIHLQKTLLLAISLQFITIGFVKAQTGTWTQVTNLAPDKNQGVMLLLTDGTVICHTQTGGGEGTGWDKLTPNASGSYVNGTWATIASNTYDRLFFSSQVLPSGKVYVAGGEYGHGDSAGEIYDPVANSWSLCGPVPNITPAGLIHQKMIGLDDGNSEILADGRVLEGPQVGLAPRGCCSVTNGYNILYYNPTTNLYSVGPNSPLNHDESQWLKLPDNSILYVGLGTDSSCRYISATNTWVRDANLPVSLYDPFGEEAGSAFMLPNGKAIFFGATPHNAIYTPSGNTSPGSWVAAADFPTI